MRHPDWQAALDRPRLNEKHLHWHALKIPGFTSITVWPKWKAPQVGYVPDRALRADGPIDTPDALPFNESLVTVGKACGAALGIAGHVFVGPHLPDGLGLSGYLLTLLFFVVVGALIGACAARAVVARSQSSWDSYEDRLTSLEPVTVLADDPVAVRAREALSRHALARTVSADFPELDCNLPAVPWLVGELFEVFTSSRQERNEAEVEHREIQQVLGDTLASEEDRVMAQVRERSQVVASRLERLDSEEAAALERLAAGVRACAQIEARARARTYLVGRPSTTSEVRA